MKLPIWLTDESDHRYHVKKRADGSLYIVDRFLDKPFELGSNADRLAVGTILDGRGLFFGRYTVVRNDAGASDALD